MEHKSTFDRVATLYGSARPGYSQELVDDIGHFAALGEGDPVLEVGCGAGQATAGFAALGIQLTAIDPGAALVAVAKQRLSDAPNVSFVVSSFEASEAAAATFKLIFAAQSWHWIAREISFPKAADLLVPSGTLAVFGHVPGALAEPHASAFKRVYLEHTGAWGPPPESGYLPSGPFASWFEESGYFEPAVHRVYRWTWRHTAQSYVAFARTRSDHQMMPPAKLESLLSALDTAIAAEGGAFDWPYETHLYMARRK